MFRNLYTSIYPSLTLNAIFGLSSIFITRKNNTRVLKNCHLLKVLNITYLALFSCLIYTTACNVSLNYLQPAYSYGVAKLGMIFQIVAQVCLFYVVYIVNITRSPKLMLCINKLKKIDDLFRNLGKVVNYYRHSLIEMIVCSVGMVALSVRAIICYFYLGRRLFTGDPMLPLSILSFSAVISYVIQAQFTLLVIIILERFNLINQSLDMLRLEKNEKVYLKSKTHDNVKIVTLLMVLYDKLTDVGEDINNCFGIQILSCLTAQFLTEVFTVFYLYYEGLVLKNKLVAFVWVLFAAWTTLEILYLTITCHLAKQQAKHTGVVIHGVLLIETESQLKRKLISFSQQVTQKTVNFSACGLFTIDATLIFTIIGAAATYLLIMLQFQESIEAQCASNITFTAI